MRKKFLSTPKRRIGFIVGSPLAVIVFSYVGGIIVQALTSETGTAEARVTAWMLLLGGLSVVYTLLVLLALAVYLCIAMYRWIQTGRWLTLGEYRRELDQRVEEEERRNARAH